MTIMQKYASTLLVILSLGAFPMLSLAQAVPFTVSDSIQMVHFEDPDGRSNRPVWKTSPDGSTALVVTTRGIVTANVVESTLWTVDLRAIARYLDDKDHGPPPRPKDVFTVKGQLRAFQNNSYGSLITESRWSADSKAIYILLEDKDGRRELDRLDVVTGHKKRLSQDGHSVTKFEIDERGVSYFASQSLEDAGPSGIETADVVNTVSGTPLWSLLSPSTLLFPNNFLFRSDSTGIRILSPASSSPEYDTSSTSPDGSKMLTLVPVEKTPLSWKRYLPGSPDKPLYRSESSTSPILEWEIVDLHTNSRRSLLGSPSGAMAGYYDEAQVVWSRESDHALVTNTFLPFDNQPQIEQVARTRPCAAAYVDVDDGSAACIVFGRSSKNESAAGWAVDSLRFGRSDHDVVIELSWYGRHKTECYSSTNGLWSEDATGVCGATNKESDDLKRAPVRLELVQDLDEPPTVWAESLTNSRRIEIWNPNPQIARKLSGTASVYHWVDKDKREWTAGLILPQGYKQGVRYPLVIQTHGFNPKEFLVDGAWTTANAARPLAAVGFVVLQIEDKQEHTGTREEADIHVDGYGAAIDQLSDSGLIDPKRVGIIGFSRTCWFVEESLLDSPERFAAAVIADGVDQSYFQYMLVAPSTTTVESERFNGGKPIGRALDTWIKSAPGFRLSELKTPLRLQAIGPASLMGEWEIYASLDVQNKSVDMLYLPLGQHVLQNPAERMASEQGDVDWFRFWLKDEEDPDPAKSIQYQRWERMRKDQSR